MENLEKTDTTKALKVMNLFKSFGKTHAVNNVTFSMEKGSIMALVGPSGCGKTTTLRLIAGFETPEKGNIELNGEVVSSDSDFTPPEKRRVGMVFQDYALFPHLTVFENVAFGLKSRSMNSEKLSAENVKTETQKSLSLVGLEGLYDRMPHQLSGGEQQRVALARALAPQPSILLLDEPFSNLDAGLRKRLRSDVKQILKTVGCSTVFVTHDQDEAFLLADQIGLMVEGALVQVGAPLDVYSNPVNLKAAEVLGEINILEGISSNGKVVTSLGEHKTVFQTKGQVKALIRPEDILINSSSAVKSHGIIVEKEFYGHHEVSIIKLNNGDLVRAKHDTQSAYLVGSYVSIKVSEPVAVFS